MEFMAIHVLQGKSHIPAWPRIPLYVFLWVIISNGQDHVPNTSHLRNWCRGSYLKIYSNLDSKACEQLNEGKGTNLMNH
jgi:hypothetical protein